MEFNIFKVLSNDQINNINGLDHKRIASLSPSTLTGFHEKNIMLKPSNVISQPSKLNLPTYSSYVAKTNHHNHHIVKNEFEPLTTTILTTNNNFQTIKYPFSNSINQQLDNQNSLISTANAEIQLQNKIASSSKFKFQQNKSKSFDAGQVEKNMLSISSKFVFI